MITPEKRHKTSILRGSSSSTLPIGTLSFTLSLATLGGSSGGSCSSLCGELREERAGSTAKPQRLLIATLHDSEEQDCTRAIARAPTIGVDLTAKGVTVAAPTRRGMARGVPTVDVQHMSERQGRTGQNGRRRVRRDEICSKADGFDTAIATERNVASDECRETDSHLIARREPRLVLLDNLTRQDERAVHLPKPDEASVAWPNRHTLRDEGAARLEMERGEHFVGGRIFFKFKLLDYE